MARMWVEPPTEAELAPLYIEALKTIYTKCTGLRATQTDEGGYIGIRGASRSTLKKMETFLAQKVGYFRCSEAASNPALYCPLPNVSAKQLDVLEHWAEQPVAQLKAHMGINASAESSLF